MDGEYQTIGLDFETLISTPNIFLEYFASGEEGASSEQPLVDGMSWYAWRSQFWGTKWNAHGFREIYCDDESYECVFDTAWRCPEPIIAAIAERYPSFEGVTETKDWSTMTMRIGSINDGIFSLDDNEYDFEDESEEDFDDDDDEGERSDL